MNIIVAGAGEVGGQVAEVLSASGHNVTVIDVRAERLQRLSDSLDVRTLVGHSAHVAVLKDSGIAECDLLIAATHVDEVNLLTAYVGKSLGARKTIARVHHTAYFSLAGSEMIQGLGVDELICPEHAASLAIARILRHPGLIVLEEFGRGQILLQQIPAVKGAPGVGQQLSDLTLPSGSRLVTVERGDLASLANANTVIFEGDTITLISEQGSAEAARRMFNPEKEGRHSVAVFGETPTAVWLCRALKSRVFSVRVFAQTRERAEELAEKLPQVTVLEADPTDAAVFAEERMQDLDAFVAATDDDEQNILACAQAKALGVGMVVAVVQRSKYVHLFKHVRIDRGFSPSRAAAGVIERLVDTGAVRTLATFAEGVAEVYEVRVTQGAEVLGLALKDVALPGSCLVAAVRRGDRVYVPGATDEVTSDDVLLVIGPRELAGELGALFGGA